MPHHAIHRDAVAVITGGASGIGLATATRLVHEGLRVVIADLGPERLAAAAKHASPDDPERVLAIEIDVSRLDDLKRLNDIVTQRLGGADIVMNNAAIQPGSELFGRQETWERIIAINLWGVINGSRVFAPGMIERGRPGLIINTGSKQGITTPPGDPAYNVAKAGVKTFTEALQHELRNIAGCRVHAHLFIPGFVFTPLAARGVTEKPAAAWTPEQAVDYLLERMDVGDFYILCPDNDVSRSLDERRILWSAGDIVENRPPLSRWHPDYADAFKAFSQGS